MLMKKLPEEISKRVYSVLDSIDREKEKIFSMCSVQRMSFAYTERDDAEVFFREGIDIIKPVTSKKDLNGALETFANLRTKIMKRKQFGFPALISPCNMSHPSQKGHKMIEHIESSFGSSLERLKHSMEFPVRTNQLETEFEFSSVFPKNISNGETTRIFDHLCDLPLILSTLPLHIKELKLICYRLKAYGYSSTSLRMLSIEVGYLDIHNMGSTVYLTKPLAPPKSKPGKLGKIGCSGGVVLVKVHFEVSGGVLNIEANGGDGGEGGDGTAGSKGANGLYYPAFSVYFGSNFFGKRYYDGLLNSELKVAHEDKQQVDINNAKMWICYIPLVVNNLACASPEFREMLEVVEVTYRNRIIFDTNFEYFNRAGPGSKGARGNPGQTGGNGGDPGKLQLDVPVTFRKHFTLLALGGKAGKGGKGGPGGPGGRGGMTEVFEVKYVRVWEQNEKFIYRTKEHYKSGEVQNIKVSGGKMISSSYYFPRGYEGREIERKKDGEIGEIGENGKDGIENKTPSQTEFSPITESTLFSICKEMYSFSLKAKEEGRHRGERSIQNIITFIENMLDNASKQKNLFSNLKSKYSNNLLDMEVNLAEEFMQTTKNIHDALRVDLRKYKNILISVQDQISQFDAGSLTHIADKFRGKLLKESQSHLEQGNEQIKKQQSYFDAVHIITNIVNIALPVFGIGYKNQEGAKTGFKKLLNSTHKFIFDEIRPYSKNLDLAFEDYFLFIEENYNKTKELSNKIKTFVNNISKDEIRNQMNLGVQVFDLMKDYNPNTFVTSDINSRLKRLEARKVISRLKSVVFQASSQLGAQNIPELDSLIKLIDMKVDFPEKVAEVTSATSDLQLTIDRVKQRKKMLRKHFEAKVDHLTSIYDSSDSINTNAMLILFSIGKQLYSGLSSLINTAAHARQSTEFLSKIPPISPLSSPDKFRRVLNILKNELNTVKNMHDGEITVVLNEMDFPYEFELLRTKRHAVFPVFDKKKGDFWIESVKAILNNISSEGMYYMTSIEHSGSVLFDLGDDLKLEPAVFESVYSVPGPEWIFSPVSVYNNIELINYPFSSYYKISIPENHTSVNIVSNINLNMSSFCQIELIFKVWYKN
ncbi:uncharacterized protein LOC136034461 [Artemia franciscana]|uniref:uncharacterized protein LOC136034461 n=1 Tax=Artemia franciscana TaxID=6661 RepID=UPI0032DB551D